MSNSSGSRSLNALRGVLIGCAEVVPGVSGGTVALLVGVYEQLIDSAGRLSTAARIALTDLPRGRGIARAKDASRGIDWQLLIPLLTGMAAALVLGAKLIAPLIEDHPQAARALFFGLVLASLWVPFSRSGHWTGAHFALAAAVGIGAFVLTGLPPAHASTNPLIVMMAASVAITALVLPGVSGSFLLLTMGLYDPTIEAVNDRDLGYLAAFAFGAVLGLAIFVKILRWLLAEHHHLTLVVMTGLMAGSLRALWPWQDDDRNLHAPGDALAGTVALMFLGFAIVVAVLYVEYRATRPARGLHARV